MSSQSLPLKACEGKMEKFLLLKFIGLIFFVCVHDAGIELQTLVMFPGVCMPDCLCGNLSLLVV